MKCIIDVEYVSQFKNYAVSYQEKGKEYSVKFEYNVAIVPENLSLLLTKISNTRYCLYFPEWAIDVLAFWLIQN